MTKTKSKTRAKSNFKNNKKNHTLKHRRPAIMHNIVDKVNVSTMAMRAVSTDGNNWHVDTDINGIRNHANLTNADIMNIISHPAHKLDLRTRLLQSLKGVDMIRPQIDQNSMFGELDYPTVHVDKKKRSNKKGRL